jgi:hypothetical protein
MTQPAALSGDYVDLKFIKTRNVAQVVIEIPIEAADQFVADFGTPNAAKSVPVAIARLVKQRAIATSPETKDRQKFRDLPPAQQAAMRCNEPAFWKYLASLGTRAETADDAATYVRQWCLVRSRSDLNNNAKAMEAWSRLNEAYELWMRGIQ